MLVCVFCVQESAKAALKPICQKADRTTQTDRPGSEVSTHLHFELRRLPGGLASVVFTIEYGLTYTFPFGDVPDTP